MQHVESQRSDSPKERDFRAYVVTVLEHLIDDFELLGSRKMAEPHLQILRSIANAADE